MKINSNFKREKSAFAILRMLRRSDIGRGGLTFYVVKNVNGQWAYQVCDMPKNRSELTFKAGFERDNWFITLFEHEARKLVDFLNGKEPDTHPFKLCTGMMCDPYMREIVSDIIECGHDGTTDFWYKTEESRIDINIFDGSYCGEDVRVNIYPIVNGETDVNNPIGTATLIKGGIMNVTIKNGKVYNEQGEVAVLYSPGYGAGWSTWNSNNECVFAPEIVQLVIEKAPTEKIAIKCIELFGDDFYYGGVMDGLAIAWLKPGTRFRISENDGYESVDLETDRYWEIA